MSDLSDLVLEKGRIYLNRLGKPVMITRELNPVNSVFSFQDEYGDTYYRNGTYSLNGKNNKDLISKA